MSGDTNQVDKMLMQDETNQVPITNISSVPQPSSLTEEEAAFIKEITVHVKQKMANDPKKNTPEFMKTCLRDLLREKFGVQRSEEIGRVVANMKKRKVLEMQRISKERQSHSMPAQNHAIPQSVPSAAAAKVSQKDSNNALETGKNDKTQQKKTTTAKKRKGQDKSDAVQGGVDAQPPVKKTRKKKDPALPNQRKKKNTEGPEPAKVLEHELEKVGENELLTNSSYAATEPILTAMTYAQEDKSMRDTIDDKKMRSVLSRGNSTEDSTPNFPPINATETASPRDKKVSVVDKKLLHDSKSQLLFKRVLSPRGMNYTAEAQSALADGIQCHFRSIIESAISAYHKRTNCKAMEHFKQMRNVIASAETVPSPSGSTSMTLHPGEVKPENRACYGMLFGDNIAERLAAECSSQKARVREARVAAEESLREHLTQADEMLKKVQKKSGKSEKSVDGEGNVVDGVPWWKREEASENKGLLSWEELAMSRLKRKVAEKHDLGPYARRRSRRDKDTRMEETIDANESISNFPDEGVSSESSLIAGRAVTEEADPFRKYDNQTHCEEKSQTSYLLLRDDAVVALSKHVGHRYLQGEVFCECYGNAVKFAQSTM